MEPFDAKILPLVLLGAMWAAFNLFLKSFEMMNKARDKVISPKNELTEKARGHILLAEYCTLRIATFLFVTAFAALLAWVPYALPDFRRSVQVACWSVGIISIVYSSGLILFYSRDKNELREVIEQLHPSDRQRPLVTGLPTAEQIEAMRGENSP